LLESMWGWGFEIQGRTINADQLITSN